MNTLMNVPKNGSLANTNLNTNFQNWSNWIDDIFNTNLPTERTSNFNKMFSSPKVNIKEEEEAFVIEMSVPGFKKSDFNITIDQQTLSISSKSEKSNEDKNKNYNLKEFTYNNFKRNFTLPETVNTDDIDAKYSEGILYLNLPKKEEAKQKPARTIKIS